MSDLLILRHGPTQWNEEHRIQGHTDIPLSDAGRTEVQTWRIPGEFAGFLCVASPLLRAMETAHILGLAPQPNDALMEMSWGDWEGRVLDDLRTELGDAMAENEARGLDFHPPGGESPRDTQERLKPWLKSVHTPTIAVAHQGVIRALYALASGWDMRTNPPVKLDKFAGQLFRLDTDGQPHILCLNIEMRGG